MEPATTQRIEAMLCTDYIESMDLSEADREMLREELFVKDYMYQLCPDVEKFSLSAGWRSNGQGLVFRVAPMSGVDFSQGTVQADYIDETKIYSSMISRYFNPNDFEKNGYMALISVTQDTYPLSNQVTLSSTL